MEEGDIVVSQREQQRGRVLMDLEGDRLSTTEAAGALGITVRQLRRVRARMRSQGMVGLVHRNRGRTPANACDAELNARVAELYGEKYAGFNQVFFTELLEREEGIVLSRMTVRRILAAAEIAAPRPQKRSRHRRHRLRRAQAGAMIQMDGSDHDWLGERGPRLTLVGGVDDATGRAWAVFREAEDTEGYLELLFDIIAERGVPCSIYTDKTAIMLGHRRTPERVAAGTTHYPTQLTRTLDRLGIALIQARSPQAKGRIERLWKTLQDRLLCELRAKGISTLAGARQVLRNHLASHNRNFEKPALNPEPAWQPLPPSSQLEDLICWTYTRVVTNANTVSVDGLKLQLELPADDPGWARRRVQLYRRLDGTWFATCLGRGAPANPIIAVPPQAAAA